MGVKVKVIALKGRPYALRWFDPATGGERQQSSGVHDRAEAERLAKSQLPADLSWSDFLERFKVERMPAMSAGSRETYGCTFKLFEKACGPLMLRGVNAGVLSQFQACLRKRGCKEITILKHLRQVRAALQWAYDVELIDRMPSIPKGVRGSIPKTMKGRPLSPEEFERFLAAVPDVVGQSNAAAWQFFSKGLWWQGLRVSEALNLSWDQHDRHRVDLGESYPMIWIRAQLEKGKKDRMHPIAPEFAELLQQVPECDRTGPVFELPAVTRSRVSHVGANIGKAAGLLVRKDSATGREKYASFHDLRRSCALRWAAKLMPQELMEFMRHSSIQVTLDYYVGQRTMATAATMWGTYERQG